MTITDPVAKAISNVISSVGCPTCLQPAGSPCIRPVTPAPTAKPSYKQLHRARREAFRQEDTGECDPRVLSVACPICTAPPGHSCTNRRQILRRGQAHAARWYRVHDLTAQRPA